MGISVSRNGFVATANFHDILEPGRCNAYGRDSSRNEVAMAASATPAGTIKTTCTVCRARPEESRRRIAAFADNPKGGGATIHIFFPVG